MGKNIMKNEIEQKEIVDFVISEMFAPDGPLSLLKDIYLKPYDKYKISRWIRNKAKDELNINFTDDELKIKTYEEYVNGFVDLIKGDRII